MPPRKLTPVTLRPGRLRLATRPSATGSLPVANTIGTVVVAAMAAGVALLFTTITATWRCSSSAASAGNRASSFSAERNSIATFWPSTKPASRRPARNAATKCAIGASGVLRRNPMTGIGGGCPRAASGHAAAAPPSTVMNSRRLTSDIAACSPTCQRRTPEGHGAVWLVCHALSVSRRGRQVLGHAARARNGCLDPIVHGCRKRSHLRSAGGCCRDIRYVQHLPSVSRSGRLVTERRDDLHGSLHQHRIVGGKDAALQVKVVF